MSWLEKTAADPLYIFGNNLQNQKQIPSFNKSVRLIKYGDSFLYGTCAKNK